MRFHETVEDVLGNSTKIRISRLFHRTGGSHTGRDIAKLIERPANTTHRALNNLEEQGILKRSYIGSSHVYTLNKEHIFVVKAIDNMFFVEQNVLLEISKSFKDQLGKDFKKAVIFGSVAKKRERPDSDIDILIVVRDSVDLDAIEDKVNEAAILSTAATGNPCMPILVKDGEYEKKRNAKNKKGMWKDVFDRDKTITYTREDIEAYGKKNA